MAQEREEEEKRDGERAALADGEVMDGGGGAIGRAPRPSACSPCCSRRGWKQRLQRSGQTWPTAR